MKKVVISLTTIVERLSDTKYGDLGLISCIKSLDDQNYSNYEIHFNIPYFSKYSGKEYIIPDWLYAFSKVEIFRTDDLGTLTKLIPTIRRINDLETIIISVDDDLVYHPEMINEHVKNQSERDCVFGYDSMGTTNPVFGDVRDHYVVSVPFEMEGKILQHYKTVSYKRKYFEEDLFTDFVGKTTSDDILFAAYIKKQNICKIVLPYDGEEKLLTLDDWQKKGGVTTFPVISHIHHDKLQGCNDPKFLEIEEKFFIPKEFIEKGWI